MSVWKWHFAWLKSQQMKSRFLLRMLFGIEQTLHFRCFIILSNALFPIQLGFNVCQLLSGKYCHCLCIAQHNGGADTQHLQDIGKSHTIFKMKFPKCHTESCLQKAGHHVYFLRENSCHTLPPSWRGAKKARQAKQHEQRRPESWKVAMSSVHHTCKTVYDSYLQDTCFSFIKIETKIL